MKSEKLKPVPAEAYSLKTVTGSKVPTGLSYSVADWDAATEQVRTAGR